ncbi:hypothetical protein GLOIN_2v1785271 [Rhizophagus clarus]|uniref:RZ-type domain-containing protein n=1 Tax=Rhizophagus clarus TaxID=94130 RepID=A0A8H3LRM7_9GLOM|nr:hypothetical protein GLOIN_2v1785271 [Rhizophagus clarus]
MGQETTIKDENESTSNNEEQSSTDNSVQASSTKVEDTATSGYPIGNDKIIDKSDELTDVHTNTGDNLSVDISDESLETGKREVFLPADDKYESENSTTRVDRNDQKVLFDQENSDQETENVEDRKETMSTQSSFSKSQYTEQQYEVTLNYDTSNLENSRDFNDKERTKEETYIPIDNDKIIVDVPDKGELEQNLTSNLNEEKNFSKDNLSSQSENNRNKSSHIDENQYRDDQKVIVDQENSDQEMENVEDRKDLSEDDTSVNQTLSIQSSLSKSRHNEQQRGDTSKHTMRHTLNYDTSNAEGLTGLDDKERTKEKTDIPIGNEKIIDESDEWIDVQNNVPNIGEGEDEERRNNNNPLVNVKEAENVETLKREKFGHFNAPPAADQYELSSQPENNRNKASRNLYRNDQKVIVDQENSDQEMEIVENRKDLSEFFGGDDNSANQPVSKSGFDGKEHSLSSFLGKLHEPGSSPKSDHDTTKKSVTPVNYDYDVDYDDISEFPNKKNDFSSSSSSHINKEKVEPYEEQTMSETTRNSKNKNNQNLSMHGGMQKKLDDESDSLDENDDYEKGYPPSSSHIKVDSYEELTMSETTRDSQDKNNRNLSMHSGMQKKLDDESDSPDENDDYEEDFSPPSGRANKKDGASYDEEHTSEPTQNKNKQNLSTYSSIQKKLDSTSDENDESYNEEHTTSEPRNLKNNNKNRSTHHDVHKKLDENDDYDEDYPSSSGRVNEEDVESYNDERTTSEPSRNSKNKNNQNRSTRRDMQKKLDENDDYDDGYPPSSGRVNEEDVDSYNDEHTTSESSRNSKNKNNQNRSTRRDMQKKLDENDDYDDGYPPSSGRVNEEDVESYNDEHTTSEPNRNSKNKNNQNRSTHGDMQKKIDNASDSQNESYDDNISDSQKGDFQSSEHSLANKQKEVEESESYRGQRDEDTHYPEYHDSQSLSSDNRDHHSNNNREKGWKKYVSNALKGFINKGSDEIKVTFHVHFPEDIDNVGKPVILGNVKELGYWEKPIVKFRKINCTYWRSEPVTISLSANENCEIHYKYAIYLFKHYGGGEIVFEGYDDRDNRTLNIERNDQFDIFINNHSFQLQYIRDFAFVDYIFNSIRDNNLKDKVMEYQHLLKLHNDDTMRSSSLELIAKRIDDKLSRDKRLFLCLLLGYYTSRRQGSFYEIQNKFPSGLLLNALEDYRHDTLPSNTKDQMYSAIINLVQHNAATMKFDWLVIFAIASEVDPNFSFIDRLKSLKYTNDSLTKFIHGFNMVKPYIDGIEIETYVKIAKWLIRLCNNMDYLFFIWSNILIHNSKLDKIIFKCFTEQIREFVSHDDAADLEYHFSKVPADYRFDVSEVFRSQSLFLLEGLNRNWTEENITAIENLFHDDSLHWTKDDIILSLDLVSQSSALQLLNIFPEILDEWFRKEFSDKEKKIQKISVIWFKNLLTKLDKGTSTSNKRDINIVVSIFSQLERIYPLLGHRKNVWQGLTAIAIERVKMCSESRIFDATKFLFRMKQQEIKTLFLDMVKEMLNKSVQQINEQLTNKIQAICDCKTKILMVPNQMSEEILCHIMNRLQSQFSASNPLEQHLIILRASEFWRFILRATGEVAKLHSNPVVKRVKASINELGGLLREKTVDMQLLQQIFECTNEKLFQHFDAAVSKKKDIGEVIVSRKEIAELRQICNNFETQLDVLFKFYTDFCPDPQVTDVDDYIQDLKQHMPNSNKVMLKEVLSTDYWAFHEKTWDNARRCYKFRQSRSFRNIFEDCIRKDTAATKVEYIAQTLIPAVFEKYNGICKQFKEWEKLKIFDVTLFCKNVTNVNAELGLMEVNKGYKSQKFMQTLEHISRIPHWIERLEELETVLRLFEVARRDDDWLKESIDKLKDDSIKLGQINNFFAGLNEKLHDVNNEGWKLIKELSNADDFISFLKEIAEHDIKNLINGVDDHSDERLIQEDTVSSLIQVKQFLSPFMNNKKANITNFLVSISVVIHDNPTLGEKIALCNSCNMALRNMYKSIENRGEATKEKIKNAVLNGSYTFGRDEKDDKCFVSLKYTSKTSKSEMIMTYNMNEILDLRGRALLIAKPKISEDGVINEKDEEISKNIMDEFVVQVDLAQEIINVLSMLIQLGHFGYRKFKKDLMETDNMIDNMKDYLKFLQGELEDWQKTVDDAQEECYYLTFFPARHILAFYDYFTSEKLDEENEEECKTLIRFVNSKAQLPSRKDIKGISRGSKDYLKVLCEIGNKLEEIFRDIQKQPRRLKAAGQRVASDVVKKGKLFIAACADNTRVPNIIMSLYANHGYYPEPWQLLICTPSTTMEELTIFIKRSYFASEHGYEDHLFCIANLELLDFELQYDLVNQIRWMQDQEDYHLALICCRENGIHHHILDQFSSDVKATNGLNNDSMRGIYRELCQNVIRVSSDLSGQGKTEWIKEDSFKKKKIPCSFLISDDMEFGRLVHQFKECKLRPVESLHINIISANYPGDVNMFLFELLTLGIVSTNVDIVCLPPSETPTPIYIEIASTTEQHLLNSLPMAGYLLTNHISWNIKHLKASQEINSPIQVTCHYLNLFDRNDIDSKEILFRTDKAIKDPLPPERCQNLIEKYFFSKGNKDISSFRFVEIFINVLADQLVRFSSSQFFTVDNLKLMVKETNIRNLILKTLIDVSKDFATRSIKTKAAQLESISAGDADDENARLGTIVQWDDSNHLIVFFNSQTTDTISALYRDRTKVHENVEILLKSQVIGTDRENWRLDDYNLMSADDLFLKLEYLARRSTEKLVLPEYALSCDNLIKMALILLRARANIPVIVCGEAGCGKTSLIAYLAEMVEVQFQALNLHAGIDERAIMMFMDDSLEKAEKGEIWLFFDEINTCNHIGLLADLISHRMLNGKPIHPNIRLFSACNPYRLRTKAQSEAGLTNRVKKFEEQSKLVYQVKPLPDQILDYVWDYGTLKPQDEFKYIQIMVEKELKTLAHPVLAELLFASQEFIRKVEERYSVSLRDVKRAIKLVKFFHNSLHNRPVYKKGHVYPPSVNPPIKTRSFVLALSLCYHSRLYEQDLRKQYRREMGQILHKYEAYVGEDMFAKIIRDEQEDYINRMQCPPNTAHNEALLENVLVMIVCILTRIPLFLIGAPGSSKSLAIRLISSNLRGSDSSDRYFRKLPQVYLIPHQGSSSSTSEGIIKVFDKANKFQETTSKQFPVISVVLLDEVGLAETSPFNPLKVLHSLLEPSYPATGPTVSVIGISNWRLDNSKSSRALLVQRPQFNLEDLIDTAVRLLSERANVSGQISALKPLAKAYSNFEKHGQASSNFHGLRDYYALVKRLSLDEMTPENIQMALARNFGGTDNHVKLCEKYFGNVLKMFNNHKPWTYEQIPIEQLIDSNLKDSDARNLMVIGKSDSIVNLLTYQLRRRDLDPVVILGSQFPDDREDYYYSVLRRIMMCVEAGRPLILTDLEIIYGSLYDLWNQNYIVVGSKDNVKYFTRVALGAYANPMLYVSPNFKCILVMDENKLALADPPLLNRFEKQKMSINDSLDYNQKLLFENLNDWARKISTEINTSSQSRNKFTQKDLFIGFDKNETLQSLIIDITKNNPEADDDEILEKCKECLIATASSDGVVRAEQSALEPDEFDKWKHVYFHKQHHDSLCDYFGNQENSLSDPNGHLLIINTFSNINTDVKLCLQELVSCQVDKLSIFKTEAQLSNRVKHFWSGESNDQLLILQCDVNSVNTGCIKLAKFIIEQFRNEFIAKRDQMPMKHACIILHIHRDQESTFSSFNFMCGWKQITIETLLGSDVPTSGLLDGSLSHIVNSTYPFEKILQQELLWCLSCMKYPSNDKSINHINTLNEKILEYPNFIKCLKVKVLEWIGNQPTSDWQYKVASNKQNLYPYSSFSVALQAHIRTLFRKPIAQILCALERLSATKTFFYINEQARSKGKYEKLLEFWERIYMNEKIVKIEDMQNPKPDGYNMPAGSLLDLKFPFSLYFMNQINSFKRIYEEEITELQKDDDRIDEETNELYDYVIEDHLKEFKNNIPLLKDSPFELEWASELYFNDFVTIIASKDGETKNKKLLTSILKLLIGADKVRKPIFLHAYWWKNGNEVLALLQLAQMSSKIIENIENQGIVTGDLEKHLVKELIKLMLRQICDSAANSHSIDKWQHDVTKVLSLVSKITRAKNLPDLQLLRIVNDLAAAKTIPLDSIREIVQLGLSSDDQEVLSEKFVSTVFDKLDKLEHNEKSIIPRRSFIMKCLALIPIDSNVRLSFYEKLFSKEPFPLMGAIIERIFIKEDEENEDIFFTVITDFEEALIQSPRLNIINKCLENLGTDMATLCCDTIEQTFFMNEELENLGAFIGPALEALYKQGIPSLQTITSIALLKEFVCRFWDSFIKKDNNNPDQMDEYDFDNDFDNNEFLEQINNILTFVHPLIHSLKIYFLRDLCRRDFSMDDIRKFCDAQKHLLPWLGSFNWEDIKENRLSFNPYCYLREYNEVENSIMSFYSVGNKAPFLKFIQNMNQNVTLTAKLSFMGLFFVRLHALRASREWQHSEDQTAKFLIKELVATNLPDLYKTIAINILQNKQPLLKINSSEISNTELLIKSVIAHIVIFHASIEPNSSQLAMYLHKLLECQNSFILSCISDIESIVLNAVAITEKTNTNKLTRYSCKCGYKYLIANCGGAVITSKCPECGNTIGGANHQAAEGNTMLDNKPIAQLDANDQTGYIGEPVNQNLYHSFRYMTPTSYRILHLIVHVLIGASAPQPALVFLQKNDQTATDSENYCMDHIRNDWETLKNLLNCSDANLALMFHSLISLMIEKPLSNQQVTTSAEREKWETEFTNYITPLIKNITETATNYRMKLSEALNKNQKGSLIENEINQTLVMDQRYRSENLPNLWRTIGTISFDGFRAYYMSDTTRNSNFPFLSVFFKYSQQLKLLKHLLPIVKFVQILHSKLGYQLTRQDAGEMSFIKFINRESNDGNNEEVFNNLKTAFDGFKLGWNTVISSVDRYQCHELPDDKPVIGDDSPVVFGLVEQKDSGIFLCAILYYLINIQNKFLQEVIEIPPGTCKSLKFLDEPTFDFESPTSKTKPEIPNGYCLQPMYLDYVRSVNIINFEWDDDILTYSQRNLAIARGEDIVYDLTKIEAELANILVFEKVYIETQPDSQLYLEPFPYHMELFQGYMRILSDIKNLITQEPIPVEKMNDLGFYRNSGLRHASESVLDNASEILSSLEILLCFVKRTAVGDREKPIKDYVSQWMKLSSLSEHEGFAKILNVNLRLKHLVSLYELVEEQVADIKIRYIHEKYKENLSADMEKAIINSVDFEQQTTMKKAIPAEAFALALKRFMLRFLTLENQKEKDPLSVYLQDSTLNFWPSTISEELIDELFPENLFVANTYYAYAFTMNKIEQTRRKQEQASINKPITSPNNNQMGPRPTTIKSVPIKKKNERRKPNKYNKFDDM